MEWMPYGPRAVLIRFADRIGDEAFERGRALTQYLMDHPPSGLVDVVPAFTSLLLEFDPAAIQDITPDMPRLMTALQDATLRPKDPASIVPIEVIYDGPDLERVAAHAGLDVAAVCRLHAEPVYKVYMLGFSPGFPYLGDLDPRLHTPRLATPRRRVPAGSVAIGGEHTGIYSVDRPGGWNLIGRTNAVLYNPNRVSRPGAEEEAFLLQPGDRVKFVPIEALG